MATHRTFIAVETSPDVRAGAERLIQRLRLANAKVNWVDSGNIHLTLKFLGDLSEQQVADVCRSVGESARQAVPFEITCRGAGAFPATERPRTVWIGMSDGQDQLIRLQRAIEGELEQLGFAREHRRFRPHLTIGRVRGQGTGVGELGQLIEQHQDIPIGRSIVDEVVVFSSVLTRNGPIYTPLSSAELGA